MTSDERGWCICRLVPNAKYEGSWTNDTAVWKDERPIPPEEEIQAYYEMWQAEESKKRAIADAHTTYYAALEEGYTDENGITWYRNERAVMDLTMMVVLNTLDTEEPLSILSMSHGIQELSFEQFKALAVTLGRYVYGLRQNLWGAILIA